MTDQETIDQMKEQSKDKLVFMSKLLMTYERFQISQAKEHEASHWLKLTNIK